MQFEEDFLKLIRLVSPGTELREGLEMILQRGTGGLIVIGENEKVLSLIDGGFHIDCPLTPTALAELAKMDGAIIVSRDIKRILYANTQLIPDYVIPTKERGTRHRSANRMAIQVDCPVIAISQTRTIVTLYKGESKYVLKLITELLRRSTQALQALEKYRIAFTETLIELDDVEFRNEVRLFDVLNVVQKGEVIKRIKDEVERYIVELGDEARLVNIQFKEILGGSVAEAEQVVQDYARENSSDAAEQLEELSMDELLQTNAILGSLGYDPRPDSLDIAVSPRGYRMLNKIPRLPRVVVENVVGSLGNLYNIMKATPLELTDIDEVGEKRANAIKLELERLRGRALAGGH